MGETKRIFFFGVKKILVPFGYILRTSTGDLLPNLQATFHARNDAPNWRVREGCVCDCVRRAFIFLRCETRNYQKNSKSSQHEGNRQRLREMKPFQSQSQAVHRGASNSPHRLSSGGVSPLSSANITLISALLILTIPICYSESNIYLLNLLWFC